MGSPLDEIGERQDAAIIRCTRAAGYRSSFEPGAAYEVNSENRVGLQRTNSIQTLATFFGWCTVINLVAILIVFVFSNFMHEFFGRVFARTFGVGEMAAKETLLRVLAQYRLAFVVFNPVPCIAMNIMA